MPGAGGSGGKGHQAHPRRTMSRLSGDRPTLAPRPVTVARRDDHDGPKRDGRVDIVRGQHQAYQGELLVSENGVGHTGLPPALGRFMEEFERAAVDALAQAKALETLLGMLLLVIKLDNPGAVQAVLERFEQFIDERLGPRAGVVELSQQSVEKHRITHYELLERVKMIVGDE